MANLPAPGTFRLYPFAEPPVPAGEYVLTGDVGGLPGQVEQLRAAVHLTAPRFVMPPDQILSTFPPAGSTGSFGTRLPQIVLRRRTLPWERSPDLDHNVATTPTPWLALVLLAAGEGQLRTDVDVKDTVTPGVSLGDDTDAPKGACLEIPASVVTKVFPTRDDLPMLCHLREVDLADTELALGDDDGYMAVVLGNRLPQPGVKYLACLVNLEGQYDRLPVIPDEQLVISYIPAGAVFDIGSQLRASYGDQVSFDTAAMGLLPPGGPGPAAAGRATAAEPDAAAAEPDALAAEPAGEGGPVVESAHGAAARTGAAWASATNPAAPAVADTTAAAKLKLADGFSYPVRGTLTGIAGDPVLRFPVLAYWSFTCDDGGDFQFLAERVQVRMLGHVVTGQETPDGDGTAPDSSQAPVAPEPPPTRPLPLVTATGHVQLDHLSREGEPSPAWFRGPLAPAAVPRAEPPAPGQPPPLAHHADQLRRVTPDGQEDVGYAAAFEIGRLLALSQPGVAGALARWRAEAYGAARVQQVVADALSELPAPVATGLDAADPLTDPALATRPRTLGARASRTLAGLLGADPGAAFGPARPVADPGNAAGSLQAVHAQGPAGLLTGLAVPGVTAASDPATLLNQLSAAPAVAVTPGPAGTTPGTAGPVPTAARVAALRASLEAAVAAPAAGAAPTHVPEPPGPVGPVGPTGPVGPVGPVKAATETAGEAGPDGDALDELIRRATRRRDGRP
jgi:hypothetical protein